MRYSHFVLLIAVVFLACCNTFATADSSLEIKTTDVISRDEVTGTNEKRRYLKGSKKEINGDEERAAPVGLNKLFGAVKITNFQQFSKLPFLKQIAQIKSKYGAGVAKAFAKWRSTQKKNLISSLATAGSRKIIHVYTLTDVSSGVKYRHFQCGFGGCRYPRSPTNRLAVNAMGTLDPAILRVKQKPVEMQTTVEVTPTSTTPLMPTTRSLVWTLLRRIGTVDSKCELQLAYNWRDGHQTLLIHSQ
ncbi:hypothetical protein P3T76_015281 [Phytophthora citrophthora]|uniref:RxLR effector protein n=1 Tax=Phytophthora citrophthora TaxID=4793 RepID=A0AAD9LAB5_9STRA|nr:hypothetical protein P3T76_015281 [Phytophthora citrophthora]